MARMAGTALVAALAASQSSALQLTAARANWTDETFGKEKCPCVGINGLAGTTTVTIGAKGYPDLYSSSIGSACVAWDDGKYPGSCDGADGAAPEGWCSKSWCYVDPCNCDIGTNPSTSDYLAGATYEGKQIFYSYATCGTENLYSTPPSDEQATECAKPWDTATFGLEQCPCVGINGLKGTTTVTIEATDYSDIYPSDLGSACVPWDQSKYPGSCDGATPADWCDQSWCYVDSKNCVLDKGPFPTYYLKNGKFQGENLFYSYLTCAGDNSFTTPAPAQA